MKPVNFDYVRAKSADHACAVLNENPDAQLIAGGQTLVPLLNMRLARPTVLVDIADVGELAAISLDDGVLNIGATARQLTVETNALVAAHCPLLCKALPWVGHRATRARGTIGGSLAVAHPAAEIPLIAVALGATIKASDHGGHMAFKAHDFFIGELQTELPESACITALSFPAFEAARIGTGFAEVSTRRSDFAIASACVRLGYDAGGVLIDVQAAIGGISQTPQRLDALAGQLRGQTLTDDVIDEALRDLEPRLEADDDLHASADYRRRAAGTLLHKALREALAEVHADG